LLLLDLSPCPSVLVAVRLHQAPRRCCCSPWTIDGPTPLALFQVLASSLEFAGAPLQLEAKPAYLKRKVDERHTKPLSPFNGEVRPADGGQQTVAQMNTCTDLTGAPDGQNAGRVSRRVGGRRGGMAA
jgi:hypothetical protein